VSKGRWTAGCFCNLGASKGFSCLGVGEYHSVEDLVSDSERGAWAAHHGENRFARYRRVDESESSLKRSKSVTIKNQVYFIKISATSRLEEKRQLAVYSFDQRNQQRSYEVLNNKSLNSLKLEGG
jgi:hypothetical protein